MNLILFINLSRNINKNILTLLPYFNCMLKFNSFIIFNYSFYTASLGQGVINIHIQTLTFQLHKRKLNTSKTTLIRLFLN